MYECAIIYRVCVCVDFFDLVQNRDRWRAVVNAAMKLQFTYEGWNFNSGNYLFTTDTK